MPKRHSVTIILRSCLTGNAVWIYRGPSKDAARVAYWRACRKELERVRHWGDTMARRRANVERMISGCTDGLPIDAELTPEQKDAARQLRAMAGKDPGCRSEFYEHIMEERRRRSEDREIRRKMRERQNKL